MKKSNCTIGIVALSLPSIGKREGRIQRAIEHLESQEYQVKIGKSVFFNESFRSSPIDVRVQDIMDMFADDSIDVILNTTGGYNSNEILEFLDYKIIQENSKPFIGYSDITAVNLALYNLAQVPTINGPMLVDYDDDSTVFKRLMTCIETGIVDFSMPKETWEWDQRYNCPFDGIKIIDGKQSNCTGKCIAGNLSTFNLLLGTPYMPTCEDCILFLEYDKYEEDSLPSLQRNLWQLRQNGFFDRIAGFALGVLPMEVKKEESPICNISSILSEVTMGYDFPVLYNAPFGHLYPSWILQNGAPISIDNTRLKAHSVP